MISSFAVAVIIDIQISIPMLQGFLRGWRRCIGCADKKAKGQILLIRVHECSMLEAEAETIVFFTILLLHL